MAREFKLCILRVRHDTRVATIGDDDCRRFLIEAADRSAIVQYWRDVFDDLPATRRDFGLPGFAPVVPAVGSGFTTLRKARRADG